MRIGGRFGMAILIVVAILIGPGTSAAQGLDGPLRVELKAGGPCACRCPILGGDWELGLLGQTVALGTRSALVVCGTQLSAGVNPGAPDVLGAPRLGSRLRFNPNGLGQGGPAG